MSSDEEAGESCCQKSGAARQIDKGGESAYGECHVTSLHDAYGSLMRLRIDRADPRVLITRKTLFQMPPPDPEWPWPVTFDGNIVRIRGENRTVLYRIGQYQPDLDCYEAEWPD